MTGLSVVVVAMSQTRSCPVVSGNKKPVILYKKSTHLESRTGTVLGHLVGNPEETSVINQV